MDTKTAAKTLRANLKAAGYNARKVGVRVRDLTTEAAIDVTIKAVDVDATKVREIAEAFAQIDRCGFTGEILGGGNTFVNVEWARGILEAEAAELIAALEAGETGRFRGWIAYELDNRPGFFVGMPEGFTGGPAPVYAFGAEHAARQIAEKALTGAAA